METRKGTDGVERPVITVKECSGTSLDICSETGRFLCRVNFFEPGAAGRWIIDICLPESEEIAPGLKVCAWEGGSPVISKILHRAAVVSVSRNTL